MIISGFIKNSFVDFPGKIAAAVFTQGCNMNCFFCHNKKLISQVNRDDNNHLKMTEFTREDILTFLKSRKGLIDAVVITGGEPTIQPGLLEFLNEIKKIEYLVKLDTNGTNPDLIKRLIKEELIDYCAMDVKTTFDKYNLVCGTSIDIDKIKSTIHILMNSKIRYEFRTTFYPEMTKDDIFNILKTIKGAEHYAIQKYRNPETIIDKSDCKVDFNEVKDIAVKKIVEKIEVRGF